MNHLYYLSIAIISAIVSLYMIAPVNLFASLFIGLLIGFKFNFLILGVHVWYKKDEEMHYLKLKRKCVPSQLQMIPLKQQKGIKLMITFLLTQLASLLIGTIAIVSSILINSSFFYALLLPFVLVNLYVSVLIIGLKTNEGVSSLDLFLSICSSNEIKKAYTILNTLNRENIPSFDFATLDEDLFAFTYDADINNIFIFKAHIFELKRLDALNRKTEVLNRLLTLASMDLGSFQQQKINEELFVRYAFYTKEYDKLPDIYQNLLNNPLIKDEKSLPVYVQIIDQFFIKNNVGVAKALYLESEDRFSELTVIGYVNMDEWIHLNIQNLFKCDQDVEEVDKIANNTINVLTVGQNIKKTRERKRMSLASCAHQLGVKLDTLIAWESNHRTLTVNELISVTRVLDITVKDLVYEETASINVKQFNLLPLIIILIVLSIVWLFIL